MGVLSGYRVIDLSITMAGPLAAMRLGDLGADVIKVEPPAGEWQRHAPAGGASGHQVNASFLALNRNKRSLAVDLKLSEGQAIALDLARTSDVFLQNYRGGVAERLGGRAERGPARVAGSGHGRPGGRLLLRDPPDDRGGLGAAPFSRLPGVPGGPPPPCAKG